MKKIFALILTLGLVGCAQVDEDTYKKAGSTYGQSDGWFTDSNGDLHMILNGSSVGNIDSSGDLTLSGSVTAQSVAPVDDADIVFGTGSDFGLTFDASVSDPDSAFIGVGQDSRQLVIAEWADVGTDLAIAQQTNPTVKVHSADATDTTLWVSLAHDQTNGVLAVGSGQVSIPAGITSAKTTGAMTFTGNGTTFVILDNDSASLDIGSTGATDLMSFDTSNNSEEVIITGYAGTDALSVAAGNVSFDTDLLVAGDTTLSGGAGSLTFDTGDESIVVKDNDTTALVIGSAGHLNLVTIDSGNDTETFILTGETAVDTFHVDVGTSQFDENVDVTGGVDITGALTVSTTTDQNGVISCGAGAGAITFDGATGTNTIVIEDNVSSGLAIGSTGAADLLVFKTSDDTEALVVTGYAGADSVHIDVGTLQCDENADFGAGVDVTGALTVSTTSDLNGVASFGAGAGAITFDGATGTNSILVEDDDAAGLDIGAAGATAMMTFDTQNGAENVYFPLGTRSATVALAGPVTLDGSDCGRFQLVADAADADTITLPASIDGCELKFVFIGTDGGAEIDISPNASDGIHGTCTVAAAATEYSGANDADIHGSKGTINTGDRLSLLGDGTNWYITDCAGIWAN